MLMNMEWYRIFLHTAKLGNLTKAAQELHITQPSVSYAIKQLEAQLQVKLFDRLSKGVKLTPEGLDVLEYVEKSFTILHAGEKELQAIKNLTTGELRIGASGPVIKHLLLPLLDTFHAEHPDVRIRLSQGKTSDIRARLKSDQIDIGLVHMPFTDHELTVSFLAEIQDCFVVGKAYHHLTDSPIHTNELAQLPLLLLSEGSSTRIFIENWFTSQGITPDADMELSSMDMLVEMAIRGYGAALVTRSFIQQQLENQTLFELQTIEPIGPRSVGYVTRSNSSLPLIAKRFLELLQQQ